MIIQGNHPGLPPVFEPDPSRAAEPTRAPGPARHGTLMPARARAYRPRSVAQFAPDPWRNSLPIPTPLESWTIQSRQASGPPPTAPMLPALGKRDPVTGACRAAIGAAKHPGFAGAVGSRRPHRSASASKPRALNRRRLAGSCATPARRHPPPPDSSGRPPPRRGHPSARWARKSPGPFPARGLEGSVASFSSRWPRRPWALRESRHRRATRS